MEREKNPAYTSCLDSCYSCYYSVLMFVVVEWNFAVAVVVAKRMLAKVVFVVTINSHYSAHSCYCSLNWLVSLTQSVVVGENFVVFGLVDCLILNRFQI